MDSPQSDKIFREDELVIADVRKGLGSSAALTVENKTKGTHFDARHDLSPRQVEIILAGGMLNYAKSGG